MLTEHQEYVAPPQTDSLWQPALTASSAPGAAKNVLHLTYSTTFAPLCALCSYPYESGTAWSDINPTNL